MSTNQKKEIRERKNAVRISVSYREKEKYLEGEKVNAGGNVNIYRGNADKKKNT